MSKILREAIVDAKALREAALKNAEESVINKYSNEVKKTLNVLLEQEDVLGAASGDSPDEAFQEEIEEVPYAAENELAELEGSDNLSDSPTEDAVQTITLDLGALREHVESLTEKKQEDEELYEFALGEDEELEIVNEDDNLDEVELEEANLAQRLFNRIFDGDFEERKREYEKKAAKMRADQAERDRLNKQYLDQIADTERVKANDDRRAAMDLRDPYDPRYEDVVGSVYSFYEEGKDPFDTIADAIMEKLTVDMGADLAGWAGRSSEDMKYQMEKEMAHRRSTEVEEEMEILKKAQEELVFENKKLTSSLSKYKKVTNELKEKIKDINLSNARLLYTNRALRNTSLNERQKNKIVEAISKADSVNEARTIYNTLQSSVESLPSRGPKSLNEAINRPSSLIRATRKESKEPNDIFSERMKKLAGIK